MKWFRMYSEFADDPKMQMMSEQNQRRFVMLMCFQSKGELHKLTDNTIPFVLRISKEEWLKTKADFIENNLLEIDSESDCFILPAWDKRQFSSDTSRERTRLWRERQKEKEKVKQKEKRTEKEKETEEETDTDTEKKPSRRRSCDKTVTSHTANKGKNKVPFPENFQLSQKLIDYCHEHKIVEPDKFYEHFENTCKANGYKYADWNLAFQNWVRDPKSDRFRKPNSKPKTLQDKNQDVLDSWLAKKIKEEQDND